jgi:hypothetical protein
LFHTVSAEREDTIYAAWFAAANIALKEVMSALMDIGFKSASE